MLQSLKQGILDFTLEVALVAEDSANNAEDKEAEHDHEVAAQHALALLQWETGSNTLFLELDILTDTS
jgi:hypothetical protein